MDKITLNYDGRDYNFSPPTRQVLSLSLSVSKKDTLKAVDVLIDNCLEATKADKEALKQDTGFLLFIAEHMDDIYGKKQGELKKT